MICTCDNMFLVSSVTFKPFRQRQSPFFHSQLHILSEFTSHLQKSASNAVTILSYTIHVKAFTTSRLIAFQRQIQIHLANILYPFVVLSSSSKCRYWRMGTSFLPFTKSISSSSKIPVGTTLSFTFVVVFHFSSL